MIIIGEKINGAIPSIKAAIAGHDEALIVERTLAQAKAGADFLDCAPSTATDIEYEKMCIRDRTQFAHPQGQVTVGMGLTGVDQHTAGAVHGLDSIVLSINDGGVHVVLVVIPMAAAVPELLVCLLYTS